MNKYMFCYIKSKCMLYVSCICRWYLLIPAVSIFQITDKHLHWWNHKMPLMILKDTLSKAFYVLLLKLKWKVQTNSYFLLHQMKVKLQELYVMSVSWFLKCITGCKGFHEFTPLTQSDLVHKLKFCMKNSVASLLRTTTEFFDFRISSRYREWISLERTPVT